MTEQEYLNVRELSDVLVINHLLRQSITWETSEVITKEEYVTVVRIITDWRERLFELAKRAEE